MTDIDDEITYDDDALPFDGDALETPQKPPDPNAPMVLGDGFDYIGRGLNLQEFVDYVDHYNFGSVPPEMVVLHHTAIPAASWAQYGDPKRYWDAGEQGKSVDQIYAKRQRQLNSIKTFYQGKNWNRGPHLMIDDRWIWLFTSMYNVGIHAMEGNSYKDQRGKLHYSIGIEVIGYYEHVVWPRPVQLLVGGAIGVLQHKLKTFEIRYQPGPRRKPAGHLHSISSHRDYNKPECPGAAITESFYISAISAAAKGV